MLLRIHLRGARRAGLQSVDKWPLRPTGNGVGPREKILVAMSGGVDSSVAALRLKQQGHDVTGAYMKNWINEDNVIGHCPWQQDIDDARAVADQLEIPFIVVNLMRDYRERVVGYLLDGYRRGLTESGRDVQPRDQVRRVSGLGSRPRLPGRRHRPLRPPD